MKRKQGTDNITKNCKEIFIYESILGIIWYARMEQKQHNNQNSYSNDKPIIPILIYNSNANYNEREIEWISNPTSLFQVSKCTLREKKEKRSI